MRRKLIITAVLAAAMIGSNASAVLAERGPMPGFGGPPPGMERSAENFEARMAKILKLTDTQKTQIKAFLDTERESVEPLREKMHQSREQLKSLADATVFDEAAVRALAVAQSQIEVELIVSHTRTLNKVNALLTPDQRELLAHLLPERK
ncbi:MAG: Spy/CpxP family protein refolding chaperone [Desulfuromonadaceae bacterium]